ncbi:MAG: hypothetical protein IVW53_02065 [Chloroflexi bacterium]|nr:hypothetical protein [Chloroflexota bacterium]
MTPPGGWLRRAGAGHAEDGSLLLWSVAEGDRGRRWRSVAPAAAGIGAALLFEVTRGGRPLRVEYSTTAGMLTLHPSGDERTLHGNVVYAAGVRPVSVRWSPESAIDVDGSPIPTAAMVERLARTVAVGEGETVPIIVVDAALDVQISSRLVRRVAERRWLIADLGARREWAIELDERGIPVLDGGVEWPLET